MNHQVSRLHLGTSGWSYEDWAGVFYPPGTAPGDYLTHYAQWFSSVEIDSTFYAIPREQIVLGWRHKTPDEFQFAAKFPRIITHEKRLQKCGPEVAAFLNVMNLLGPKLGPLLLQFEYSFEVDQLPVLDAFLSSLPAENRYAVEVRHRSWLKEELYSLLRRLNVSLVLPDLYYMPSHLNIITADFVYIRWLGNRKQVSGSAGTTEIDRRRDLARWAREVTNYLNRGLEVYGFANNHYTGYAPGALFTFQEMMVPAQHQR